MSEPIYFTNYFLGLRRPVFSEPRNDRVPRLCPAVGQLVVHEGTVVFFRQPFRLILQTTEVASVSLVVDSVVQRNQVRIFFTNIVHDVFFESASQV